MDYKKEDIPISIHALREEGDGAHGARFGGSTYFYPRPPRGGRQAQRLESCAQYVISIHALREEGDVSGAMYAKLKHRFLSTPSARRATGCNPW